MQSPDHPANGLLSQPSGRRCLLSSAAAMAAAVLSPAACAMITDESSEQLAGFRRERINYLVGNCCMPTYAAMERTSLIHCFPNYVPGWRQFGDIPDIVKLIAPRPLHLNFGELDAGSPIAEVRAAMPHLENAWAAAGAPQNFTWFIENNTDHVLSPEMWRLTKAHFAKHLKR